MSNKILCSISHAEGGSDLEQYELRPSRPDVIEGMAQDINLTK
ncbi:hypothetical protein N5J48_03170 [Acinetobacter ursingii]|jgi:hypothetical protein|nr:MULTISPECIES: hypothetical protein [Acinetobacter]EXD32451.1 hypothetical protein J500_3024 [Acinetobacter sp. 479375]MDG9859167.1 hypothetical protein [Acinetobacter ursingii]MDG9892800.1 hypothetical protein [Acinetobacter ursingii]MDG9948288.1 hypothetical protein [Acinetobacter ursingii]MDH0006277.1 hypothetical protein [Acinetobacter ursingii]